MTKLKRLTSPLVNMNGNSEKDLLSQTDKVLNALQQLRDALAAMDYDNGRNAKNAEHYNSMRSEHSDNQGLVSALYDQYIGLYNDIRENTARD